MSEVELKPCPFCGSPAKKFDHGYGDDSCSVGCSNRDCPAHCYAWAIPKSYPWDETKQTFWVDWETAEKEAAEKWNRRADIQSANAEVSRLRKRLQIISMSSSDNWDARTLAELAREALKETMT